MKSTLRKYCILITTIFSLVLSVFVLNAQTVNTTYPSAPGSVNAVVSDANYTYVGGNFTSIGSLPIKYLARIKRSDNTVDASWTPNPGNVTSGGAAVNSLALSGTDLYVSGDFTTIGGQAINKLARISTIGSGTADLTWQPNVNSRVAQMIVSGTDLFIAGIFSSIGGQPYSPLAKISTLGTGLPDPNWRPNPNLQVLSIALAGNNLYVGGAFTSIGGLTQNGIARISTTGTGDADPNWMPVITKTTGSPSIHTIKISDTGSELYIGGFFNQVGGLVRNNIAKISANGNGEVDVNWNPNANSLVNRLFVLGNNAYAAGNFFNIGGIPRSRFAKLDANGTGAVDPNWNTPFTTVNFVYAFEKVGSDLLIGGAFAVNSNTIPVQYNLLQLVGETAQVTPPVTPVIAGPAGINNGIAMWLDAADIDADGIAGNNPTLNTNFTTWKDKSGYARNATSLNTLNPITYIPNEINGNPVARFTRVNDVVGSAMQVANMDIRSITNPEVTMFTVYKTGAKGSNGQGQALWGNDNGAWDRFFYNSWNFSDDGIVSLGLGNPNFANISGAGITGKTQLMTAVYKSGMAGGSAIYFNGAVVTNFTDNTDPSAAISSLRIGSDGDNGMFNGDIAEFIVYNRKLTNCEILQVNQYLGAKYGVTFTTATITAPATTVCSGTAAELTASAGDSYQWFKDGISIASATAQTYNATATGSYTVAITTSGCTATSTATVINVTPAPVVTVTASGPTAICGGSPLVLTASTPNGGFWSTGEFGNSITVYGAGSYTVQISSEDGLCSVTSEPLVVTENPTPEITDIINDGRRDICANTTIVLRNDTPGGVWSSGNTAIATVDADGTVHGISEGNAMITYTITNETGCSNYVTYEVAILPLPVSGPLDGPTTICLNTPTTLNLTVNNGRDDRAEWTTSNANIVAITGSYPSGVNIAGLSAGTATINYYFTINGCRALVSTAQITVNPAPVAPTGTNQLRCSNGTVTLNATVAEGEQINWYDAATEGNLLFTGSAFTTPSLTATTTYYAEAINTTTGCTSTTRTAITATIGTLPVVANITGVNTVCEMGIIQLLNTTTGGVWSSNDTTIAKIDATGKLTGVKAGTVVITYTVTTATGCSTTKTFTVTIKLKPAMPVIIGETTGCLGTTLTLTATSDAPNPSFRWCNTPTANPVRTFLLEYSASLCVNVTSNGCSSDQIIVPVVAKPLPAANITAVGATSFCAGSSVQLNASTATGNTYQWKLNDNNISGATAASYIASATGNYSVAVTGANTCTATSSAITVNATDNVAPGSTAIQFTAPAAILSNVAEAAQYNLAYELNVPENGNYSVVNPTYTVNNAAQLQNIPLDRIAYYMQLNDKWVWVSMDAFTNNVSLTGIPVTNTIWQQKVNNMNVFSSANAGVTNGTGIATGSIEMWKFNYAPNINLGLPGASSSSYDYDDRPEVNGNHGSFQVHNYGIGQTIFGYSRFGQNGRGEIGIGNNTVANGGNGGHPDWTFNTNANIYSTKKIYVFVKPKAQVIAKDATIYLDANGVAVVPVTAVDNGVIDNCSTVTRTVSPAQFTGANLGANTVTVTLTDASGNSNSGTSVVTVVDNIKPVINCNNNLDVYATSSAGAIVNYAIPTATDNSGNVTITLVSGFASGSIFPIGTTTVTYKATDASGNFVECSFTVTVSGVAPVVIAPANITVNNTPGTCGAAVTFAATETTAIPASTITYSIAPGSIFAVGTTTVTATATNAVGSNAATFTVTVIDTENPTIIAPVAVGVPTDLNSNTASNVILGAPVTSDNCAIASVSNNAPTVYLIGTTTVTWTVIDIHGNRSTASQQVTVSDQQAPIVHTQNITVYLNASGTATITAAQINNGSTDNTSIATYALNESSFSCATAGEQMVVLTVTDIYGNAASANAMVTILDAIAPSVTAVANQTNCANVSGSNYTIAPLTATDNCTIASVTYTVTGATNRTGVGYDASGAFSIGTSVIKWTVTDASGNATSSSTSVTVNPLPVATITAPTADALCNQFVLTANTAAAYQWMLNNATTGSLPTLTLGLTNADGLYSLYITDANGCKSATATTYNYQKQNLVNSYTILASKEVKLGKYNKVATGSVGITSAKGEAEFKKYSSVNGAGSFVKSPKIKKDGTGVLIANSINGIASVTLPTMQLNNANTQNLASYTVSQNATQILSANYKTLTIKKGANVTVTGNSFGKIKMEEGASIRFTASTINIEEMNLDKGAKNGRYSFVRFAPNSSIRVTDKVTIGSRVRVNEENYKVTFYLKQAQYSKGHDDDDDDDHDNDGAEFSVKGSDTRVIANVIMPGGKLKVISNESDDDKDRCSHSAHNAKDCRHKNHEHNDCNHTSHSAASCNDDVYMTGLFVAAEVESEGNTVVWNSYDCSAPASISTNNDVSALVTDEVKFTPVVEQAELNVLVMPNPSTTYFTLKLTSKNEAPVNIRVVDAVGRLVDVKTKMAANSTFQIGHNYSSGTYFVELLQGNKRKVIQLIKTRG